MGITLVVFLVYLFFNRKLIDETSRYLYQFLCMCLLELFFIFLSEGLAIINMYSCIAGYVPVVLAFFAVTLNKKETKSTVILFFTLYLITSITSVVVLLTDVNASRYLATGSKDAYADYLNIRNVGGYTAVYSSVLLLPLLIFLYKRKILNRFTLLVVVLSLSIFILEASFMYAILFGTIAVCTIFYSKDATVKKGVGYILGFLIALLLLSNIFSQIFMYLSETADSISMSEKFKSLALIFAGQELEGADAIGRMELYEYSWNQFLKNPLIGNFYKGGKIGGHSYVLDTLAKYGIVGLGLLVWCYVAIYNFTIKPYKHCKGIAYFVAVYILAILVSFINTGNWIHVLLLYNTLIVRMAFLNNTEGRSVL